MFTYIPNLKETSKYTKEGRYTNYDNNPREVKNIFINVKENSLYLNEFSSWYYWDITSQDTPESIANNYYGDSRLYWIILLFNDIINIYDEWPRNNNIIESRLINKFDNLSNAMRRVNHYKHKLHRYKISDNSYKILSIRNKKNQDDGNVINPHDRLSNYEKVSEYDYAMERNEVNRTIRLLRPSMIQSFISEYDLVVNLYS